MFPILLVFFGVKNLLNKYTIKKIISGIWNIIFKLKFNILDTQMVTLWLTIVII